MKTWKESTKWTLKFMGGMYCLMSAMYVTLKMIAGFMKIMF